MNVPARGACVVRVRVGDPDGLHARPCARISEAALASRCDVVLAVRGREASGISIFEMLGLAAAGGDEVEIRVSGPDAESHAAALAAIVARRTPRGRGPQPAG